MLVRAPTAGWRTAAGLHRTDSLKALERCLLVAQVIVPGDDGFDPSLALSEHPAYILMLSSYHVRSNRIAAACSR